MRDMELLAPAGNMDALKMAIYNGANAVYLGVKEFNARNNIDGFTLDNLPEAVDLAHLYNVKVYLSLNILFTDNEIQSALDVVAEANNIGVDAFIVQDLGLANLIHTNYPSLELQASTQMAIHNLEGVRVLEKLGFSRVVLARETSKEEIKRIRDNSNIEIEFFVQGALCVGFSGNCYMCSHLVGKSGNRGVCQQFCRLPYTFESGNIKKQGFLLSAKDINMIDQLDELNRLGVKSLKIEGRARRPFYVAQACRIYRQMIDYGKFNKDEMDKLKIAFNRGYTPAYFNGNGNIISQIQGNNGLSIGKVIKVNKGNKFNEVFITSNYELKGKCGLKFIYDGEEIASIGVYDIKQVGQLYRLTTTANIKVGSNVNIIQDEVLENEVFSDIKKLPIDIKFVATAGESFKVVASCENFSVEIIGDVCQEAKTISISKEQVLKQFSRSDTFEINQFDCCINRAYILNSTINKLRNDIYNKIKQKIIKKYKKNKLNKINILENSIIANNSNKNVFNIEDICKFDKFCQDNNINGYIDIPNFATKQDIEMIKYVLDKTSIGVVVNNLYGLCFDCRKIGGQFLNVYNSYTLQVLEHLGNFEAMFVEELNDKQMAELQTNVPLLKRERAYMTLLHCPFKTNMQCECGTCKFDDNATYTINSGKKFKIKRKKTVTCVFMLKD